MPNYCNLCGAGPFDIATGEFLDHALTSPNHDKSKLVQMTESEHASWKAEMEKPHS